MLYNDPACTAYLTTPLRVAAFPLARRRFVDPDSDHHNHATIAIRMNITVPRIPCAIVSVDVQDILGSHVVRLSSQTRVAQQPSLPIDLHLFSSLAAHILPPA